VPVIARAACARDWAAGRRQVFVCPRIDGVRWTSGNIAGATVKRSALPAAAPGADFAIAAPARCDQRPRSHDVVFLIAYGARQSRTKASHGGKLIGSGSAGLGVLTSLWVDVVVGLAVAGDN
jgi:hypothetical protein